MAVSSVSHAAHHSAPPAPPAQNVKPQAQAPKTEPAHTQTKSTNKVDIKA